MFWHIVSVYCCHWRMLMSFPSESQDYCSNVPVKVLIPFLSSFDSFDLFDCCLRYERVLCKRWLQNEWRKSVGVITGDFEGCWQQ